MIATARERTDEVVGFVWPREASYLNVSTLSCEDIERLSLLQGDNCSSVSVLEDGMPKTSDVSSECGRLAELAGRGSASFKSFIDDD